MGATSFTRTRRAAAALLLLAVTAVCAAPAVRGVETSGHATEALATPRKLALTAGQSRIINYDSPVQNVAVANPSVADVLVLSPKRIYVLGKVAGLTTLTLIDERGDITLFELAVTADIGLIKEKLHEFFPAEEDLQVVAAGEGVVLTGSVSSAPVLSRVLAIAEPFAKSKIINLLEVGGVQQVMLEVRIAEMSRNTARRMGINLAMLSGTGGNIGLSMLNGIMSGSVLKDGSLELTNNSANAVYQFTEAGNNWTTFIDALKANGLAKVLAEPNLTAISGQRAFFHAGGKFPYETVSSNGELGIAWEEYGVQLSFTPTVLANNRIGVVVNPVVSSIGDSINVAGKSTPTVLRREVNTTIELGDGQSFAIAGLLQEDIREAVNKFPVLGELPILGALFRSSQFQKNETELIVIATPHLVRPLNAVEQPLPTDSFVEPSDFEFYLKGSLEAKQRPPKPGFPPSPARVKGGLEGEFGHIIPE